MVRNQCSPFPPLKTKEKKTKLNPKQADEMKQ